MQFKALCYCFLESHTHAQSECMHLKLSYRKIPQSSNPKLQYHNLFLTQLESMHLQGLCCLRLCRSRPYFHFSNFQHPVSEAANKFER